MGRTPFRRTIKTAALVFAALLVGAGGFVIGYTRRPTFTPSTTITTASEQNTLAETPSMPFAVVVPHHDLVAVQRRALFKELASAAQPKTIILVSPNHFNAGSKDVLTTDRAWTVEGGEQRIMPAAFLIKHFVEQHLVEIDDAALRGEHGVKNILADINQFFPEAQIFPLILKETIAPKTVEQLAEYLSTRCTDCGVIASVDMSHYLPARVADMHDIKTVRALTQRDNDDIWNAEVDSQASLAFLIAWAKLQHLEHFTLADHTNSGFIADNDEIETTTHILGYYTQGKTPRDTSGITFTFAGDGMFGREIGYQFQENNFRDLFSELGDRVFWGTDISWINVEGPISDITVLQSRQPNDLSFLFSRETINALQYLRLTTVGLGNNHTHNNGSAGLETTRRLLSDAGIDWHGDPYGISEQAVQRYEYGGVPVSLFAVHALIDTTGLSDLITKEDAARQFVIVLPHWGSEYQLQHSATQERLAREWIAAGADLIIGMHPHVVQDAQVIDDRLVLYSLGNFVFDQTFSQETQRGLIVTGVVSQDELQVVPLPIVSRQLKPEQAHGQERQDLIDRICAHIQEYCQADTIRIGL